MQDTYESRITSKPSIGALWRIRRSMFGQGRVTPVCPPAPRLDGRLALVTGGHRGIGLETSRGLAGRGAEVMSASRAAAPAADGAEPRGPHEFVRLDLSDLASVREACRDVAKRAAGRRLDVVVANAGVAPLGYSASAQGHELAFATNVLGHHALIRGLMQADLLADGARVVFVTGDIYVLTKGCTPDYVFRSPVGGLMAYCRSKLGNLWQMREFARRYPAFRFHAVHPGVVGSELQGGTTGISGLFKRAMMLSVSAGAQTSLFCATQPGLASGTYYHNTMGRMDLRDDDPAADPAEAARFWDALERLSQAV